MIINKANHANKINSLAKRAKLCALLFATTLISPHTFSAEENEERWFEIEVILFSQLGDKTQVKESFPDQEDQASELPNYRRIKDLLTPYIYPNLSTLKLQLPECGDFSKQQTLVELATIPTELFSTKTLKQINDSTLVDEFGNNSFDENFENPIEGSIEGDVEDNKPTPAVLVEANPTSKNLADATQLLDSEEMTPSFIPSITAKQLALVAQAETEFNNIKFEYSNGLPSKQICALPTSYSDKFSTNLDGTVDGIEYLTSDTPYLISQESLQLSDIVLKLKRSKNFKPLLHLGWREAPKDRNKATAFRVFSGKNLDFEYENAQLNYQTILQQNQERQVKRASHLAINSVNEEFISGTTNEQGLEAQEIAIPNTPEQIVQNRINDILTDINNISALNEQEIIAQLKSKNLALNIQEEIKSEHSETLLLAELQTPPAKPIQPWSLDGLFRVHLNHYLYITADFNLLTLAAPNKSKQDLQDPLVNSPQYKSIHFNQNRRVISGEIHYFDHPYIGMIVQIRKHKRPEPEEEEEVLEQMSNQNINASM